MTAADTPLETTDDRPSTPLGRLLHRWFVEYNPLYLVSAMLVLVGLSLLSRASAEDGSGTEALGVVPVIAEVYAFALIGGAALLTRIGQRRPAVMLGLLTMLYQGDLTLLTERQVHLGLAGRVAVAAWLALFVVKIHALAWALRLRVSRGFVRVAASGAAGLAILPHYLARSDATSKDAVVATWLFALVAAVLWSRRDVASATPLDAWQRAVLRRSLAATWATWGALVLLHAGFWSFEYHVGLRALLPAALLLGTRWMKDELPVWATVGAVVATVAHLAPASLWLVALMASAVLGLRALGAPATSSRVVDPGPRGDRYRRAWKAAASTVDVALRDAPEGAPRARLLGGVLFGLWLAGWTRGWTGGPLPAHVLALDLGLTAGAGLLVWRMEARAILAPLFAAYLHFAVRAGLVAAPSTSLEWGVAAVTGGFALLLGSLFLGWRLRTRVAPATARTSDT